MGRHNFYANTEERDCCQCEHQQCSHYDDDVLYISKVSREYYRATCPSCALKISSQQQFNRFWGCCIAKMQSQRAFYNLNQALGFVYHCYHFQCKRSYINFCVEGNLFENSRRHVMRYFNNIDRLEDFTSQCFKTITLSDHQVRISKHSCEASMMNTICKSHSNGLCCPNCDLQDLVFCSVNYVLLQPKANEDHFRKQVALRINVMPINNLGMRKVSLHHLQDEISL